MVRRHFLPCLDEFCGVFLRAASPASSTSIRANNTRMAVSNSVMNSSSGMIQVSRRDRTTSSARSSLRQLSNRPAAGLIPKSAMSFRGTSVGLGSTSFTWT